MKTSIPSVSLAAAGALVVFSAMTADAGPLTPPAGAVTSTYKTLSEVEPAIAIQSLSGDIGAKYVISTPGSYYLTDNIAFSNAGKQVIRIDVSGVTIDLRGFKISGGGVTPTAIFGASAPTDISIRNGTLSDFNGVAISLPSVNRGALENLTISASAAGMIAGDNFVVRNCTVSGSAGDGMSLGSRCVVTSCTASVNRGTGIKVGSSCVVSQCAIASDGGAGEGFRCLNAANIRDCSSIGVTTGFAVADASTITGCSTNNCKIVGISAASWCTVRDNLVDYGGPGTGTTRGIIVSGTSNRIEGNNVTRYAIGFDVTGVNNFLGRNTTSQVTTSFNIPASNAYGPIISITNAGNIAPIANANNPWANFIY